MPGRAVWGALCSHSNFALLSPEMTFLVAARLMDASMDIEGHKDVMGHDPFVMGGRDDRSWREAKRGWRTPHQTADSNQQD